MDRKIKHDLPKSNDDFNSTDKINDNQKEASHDTKNLSEASENETKAKKKFYKKPIFWTLLVLGIVLVAALGFIAIYLVAQSQNKQTINMGWFEITAQSDNVVSKSQDIKDEDSYNNYKSELSKLNKVVNDKKSIASKLQYKAEDAQLYQIFLDEFGNYTQSASGYADKIKDYTESNSDSLKDKSRLAKESADNLKNKVKYLKQDMPNAIYEIPNTLTEANKLLLVSELSTKAKELEQQAKTAKDQADTKSTELLVNNYLNAFIAGNAALMRQYMTEGFQKEYDFSQLTPQAREYTAPVSYRILNNQKVDDSKYKAQANILYKYRDGSGQYTLGNELNMIYDTSSARWLVNSVKEGAGF